ncbi:SDR family oxidoreductase [Streptomyces sp. OE57]|uniref:SDR family oxidoreductase n=1 Tax=Streptomyces lacaronensis TaxID=3379885 RepID=UPI0039B78B1F
MPTGRTPHGARGDHRRAKPTPVAATPSREVGTGREVGASAAFLLSDRASHIGGAVLPIDGGLCA